MGSRRGSRRGSSTRAACRPLRADGAASERGHHGAQLAMLVGQQVEVGLPALRDRTAPSRGIEVGAGQREAAARRAAHPLADRRTSSRRRGPPAPRRCGGRARAATSPGAARSRASRRAGWCRARSGDRRPRRGARAEPGSASGSGSPRRRLRSPRLGAAWRHRGSASPRAGPNRDDVLHAADDDHAVGDRRRRHHHFADRVGRQQLVGAARLDDEDVAVLARQIELAVGRDRRGAERAALPPTRCW